MRTLASFKRGKMDVLVATAATEIDAVHPRARENRAGAAVLDGLPER